MAVPLIYNVRSVLQRWVSSIVAIVGIGGAVGVFIAMMAMANGFRAAMVTSGSAQNAVLMRGGATSEMESAIGLDEVRTIGDTVGVARDRNGAPVISPELVVVTALPRKDTGTDANTQMRGVREMALTVHDRVHVVRGRYFRAGLAELVVGRNAELTVSGTEIGAHPRFGGQVWEVVGVFDSGGTAFDSEIWCDEVLLSRAFHRTESIFSSVTVRLERPAALQTFKDRVTSNPALTVQVERETDYYARQSEMITRLIRTLGALIAAIMGIGAIFGALNTMYSAVAARAREIATIRALGFGPGSVVLSFVLESLLISLAGGLLGSLVAVPINGLTVSTMNWQTFSQLAFAFRVTPPIVLSGIVFALTMGLIGGILPAIRAARLPVAIALREL